MSALTAVATISLYKYDVTHYNSVAAEQGIAIFILMLFFFTMAFFVSKENPFRYLRHRVYLTQSLLMGIDSVLMSFAFSLGTPSVVTAAKRALAILFATLSGNIYFHEKKLWIKILALILITAGLFLLP